jgi:23S rRNA (uracil1939-C5)-methyltransferase
MHDILLKNKPIYTAQINNISHDGRGIAHIDGKITLIDNALPGEQVEFCYRKRHPKFDEGYAVNIITKAAERVEPRCPHYGICGGCSLQHLEPTAQITTKQQHLLEQLLHFGKVQPKEILSPLTGSVYNYRHKARLSVKYLAAKDKVLVGFREKNSHFIADLTRCEVLALPVGQLIEPFKKLIATLEIKQHIPQLEIAIGDDATAIILRHLIAIPDADCQKLQQFAQEHNISLYLQPGNLESIHLLWPKQEKINISYFFPLYDLELFFHPANFSQVNPVINQQMIQQAITLLDPQANDEILDLFCGFGNFTLPLAKYAKHVIGIEGEKKMIACAKANAEHNHLHNISFDVADLTKPETFGAWAKRTYNKILLDPPRTGAEAILNTVTQMKPQKILYISCNPATLARDAGILVNTLGYQLTKAGVMDMFPHTSHVEAMAVFEK